MRLSSPRGNLRVPGAAVSFDADSHGIRHPAMNRATPRKPVITRDVPCCDHLASLPKRSRRPRPIRSRLKQHWSALTTPRLGTFQSYSVSWRVLPCPAHWQPGTPPLDGLDLRDALPPCLVLILWSRLLPTRCPRGTAPESGRHHYTPLHVGYARRIPPKSWALRFFSSLNEVLTDC